MVTTVAKQVQFNQPSQSNTAGIIFQTGSTKNFNPNDPIKKKKLVLFATIRLCDEIARLEEIERNLQSYLDECEAQLQALMEYKAKLDKQNTPSSASSNDLKDDIKQTKDLLKDVGEKIKVYQEMSPAQYFDKVAQATYKAVQAQQPANNKQIINALANVTPAALLKNVNNKMGANGTKTIKVGNKTYTKPKVAAVIASFAQNQQKANAQVQKRLAKVPSIQKTQSIVQSSYQQAINIGLPAPRPQPVSNKQAVELVKREVLFSGLMKQLIVHQAHIKAAGGMENYMILRAVGVTNAVDSIIDQQNEISINILNATKNNVLKSEVDSLEQQSSRLIAEGQRNNTTTIEEVDDNRSEFTSGYGNSF